MDFVLLSKTKGGQFMESGEVLNYPGIKKTTGAEFEKLMEDQLKFNNVELKFPETVSKIEKIGDNFKIISDKGEYEARAVILTTGARPRELNVPGEKEYKNKGVTYCAVCDGPLFADKEVAVIGGGDSALEAVDFLLNIAKKIYLINLTEELKAHEYLQERISGHEKVEVINNASTTEIIGDGKTVTGIKYKQGDEEKEISIQGVFVEIGRVPNTDFLEGFIELDEHKHIKIDEWCYASQEGVFAAGDCSSVHEYQYVIAAGQATIALLKAARYLAKKK